ncbi:hypothetical protein Bhyg_03988 [Pseudolycoriella hygida]|uniref:Uncharacterized protein n=1 Tax=Pseudolycoriella hygida TaxID=35572 RepID=A0A9Q0S803_9DIPT|nr:hypothetical protein Bhyg_03988 [Pseudolycoriella hygida]
MFASWWNVTNGCLYIVWNPFDEVAAVLVLNVEHLFVDFFHGHATAENSGNCQVTTMSWITGSHHVLGIEHLLGQFGFFTNIYSKNTEQNTTVFNECCKSLSP